MKDLKDKLLALREIYKSSHSNGILFEKQNNINWLVRGRNFINMAVENAVCNFLLTDNGFYLVTDNIEKARMLEEEYGNTGDFKIIEYNWYDEKQKLDRIAEYTDGKYIVDSQVDRLIRPLRLQLTGEEILNYRKLGEMTAEILEEVCFAAVPGMTESEVAALAAGKAVEAGLEPVVLLVGSDERIFKYRHPLPSFKKIGQYVMIVVGFRKYGLICCSTRFVSFGKVGEELSKKRDACMRVFAAALGASRPGVELSEVFDLITKQYAENGYPGEWKLHHQGGLMGYNGREYKAVQDLEIAIGLNQAVGWNPSITGFKCEDTAIILEKRNEILTHTRRLPFRIVDYGNTAYKVADILMK